MKDEGSIMLLGIGMIGVCLLALAVITDSAGAFIQQRELQSVADSIALAGAQGIDLEQYYRTGAGSLVEKSHNAEPEPVGNRKIYQYRTRTGS